MSRLRRCNFAPGQRVSCLWRRATALRAFNGAFVELLSVGSARCDSYQRGHFAITVATVNGETNLFVTSGADAGAQH